MRFLCGCCGKSFDSTKEEQRKHDQDKGYGICDTCEGYIAQRNEDDWRRAEQNFSDSLNDVNREKFLSMELELRRGIILQAIDDGVVTFDRVRRRG